MDKYYLEFILSMRDSSLEAIKSSLSEFGEEIKICGPLEDKGIQPHDLKVSILTQEPTIVFDICSEFGRIKSVKASEVKGGI